MEITMEVVYVYRGIEYTRKK